MFKHLSTISLCLLMLGFTSDRIAFAQTNNSTDRANATSKQLPKAKYTGTVKRVDDIAQQITIRIEDVNGGNGSGAIVAKQGDTYYVATAAHVVQDIKKVNGRKVPKQKIAKVLVTPSGERITLDPRDINVANVDLDVAVVKFRSRQNYRVAQLGRYSFNKTDWVFVSGFPGVERGQRRLSIGVTPDRSKAEFLVKSRDREFGSLANGNGLVYTNLSLPGMSGGAVLDRQGRVVGINTGAENEVAGGAEINYGFALGIPIATVLGVGGIPIGSQQIASTPATNPTESESAQIERIQLSALSKPSVTARADAWLDYGNLLWRTKNKSRESVAAFERAIKLLQREPDNRERKNKLRIAYFGMGLAWLYAKENPAAATAFEQAAKYAPQAYESWRYLGQSLRELKQYDRSIAAYKQAIALQKQDFVLYTELGDVLGKRKRYSEAINFYNAAISLQPTHPWVYNNRGIVYYEQKQYERALAEFNQAIKLDPNDANAYDNRGNAYDELKQYQRALADYNQAIKLDPNHASAYNNRGIVYGKLKQYKRALAEFNQAIKLDPNLAMAYNSRGSVYAELKQYERALAEFNQAIKLDPNLAMAYHNRGFVYNNLKQYERALAEFNQAIKLDPNLAIAYDNRGGVYYEQKQYERALADFSQAIKLDPSFAIAYNNRGNAYDEIEQYERALADYNQAIKFDPNLAMAYYNRGIVYNNLKQYERALADYNQAIKLNPNYAAAYTNRGLVHALQNRYPLAQADLEKAAQLYRAQNDLQKYQRAMEVLQELKAAMR